MGGRNFYERVRAAYGLEDDDDLRDLSLRTPVRRGVSGSASRNNAVASAGSASPGSNRLAGYRVNAHTPASPPYGSVPAPYVRETAEPLPPPPPPLLRLPDLLPSPLAKVNSVRVPFDPEDQSDDEVIITTAYQRQMRTGDNQQPSASATERPPKQSPGKHQSTTNSKTLSPTAAPFQPTNGASRPVSTAPKESAAAPSEPLQPPKPLVDIVGAKGNPNDAAKVGLPYPGHRTSYCPWVLVANYHLWFVGKQNSERIKPYFEEEALLQAQDWDFCYVWLPVKDGKDEQPQPQPKPQTQDSTSRLPHEHAVLVPSHQFQHFMNRINQTLGIQLIIPPGPSGEKFRVFFGQQRTPIPRFLGRARDKATFASMVRNVPAFNDCDSTEHMKPQAKKMYERKTACLVYRYDKNKMDQKNAKADRHRIRRQRERQGVGRQIKRIQRYVGLRPKADLGQGRGQPQKPPGTLDLTQPLPHAPEGDVVFVSMDIESYEHNHRALTEIGFGILDTRDIAGVAPGVQCENWFVKIQARHIRIREHASMVNRLYVHGCEDNFNFGTSEFVALADVLGLVTGILQPGRDSGEPRKVVLLGHDTQSDISLIANVGFVVKDGMFLEILDTQDIHRHFRMRHQQMGLRAVLSDLEIEHSFLHNGGNDAVYTLQAMLALVVKKRQDSLRRQNERMQPGFAVDPEVLEQGWASGGEDSDGGSPERQSGSDDGGDGRGRGGHPLRQGYGGGRGYSSKQGNDGGGGYPVKKKGRRGNSVSKAARSNSPKSWEEDTAQDESVPESGPAKREADLLKLGGSPSTSIEEDSTEDLIEL